MNIVRRLYSIYCLFSFVTLFLLFWPFYWILIQRKSWHRYALQLNCIWAPITFFIWGIRIVKEYREPLDKKGQYVLCANHFSYIDILVMSLISMPIVFIGKKSMAKIPLFGYLYRKLHVLVDRESNRSRYNALQQSLAVIDRGFSLAIFPEGGIKSKNPPQITSFKQGAFKVAIESKVPIVPVTLPYNYLFFPDDGEFLLRHRSLKIIFHESIDTSGYTDDDINRLNQKVFDIIASELERQSNHADHKGNS